MASALDPSASPPAAGDTVLKRRARWLSEAALWAAGLLFAAILFDLLWEAILKRALGFGGADFRTTGLAVAAEVVASIPAMCLVMALSALGGVFARIGDGKVLVADNAAGLVRAGEWVVGAAAANMLGWSDPVDGTLPGQRLWFDFSWEALALGLFGAALILLGDVLRTAVRAQSELDEIV